MIELSRDLSPGGRLSPGEEEGDGARGATVEGVCLCSCSCLFQPSRGCALWDSRYCPGPVGCLCSWADKIIVTFMLLLILLSSCLHPRFRLHLRKLISCASEVCWQITGMGSQIHCYLKTHAWHSLCVRHCSKHSANVKSFCPYKKPTCQVLRSITILHSGTRTWDCSSNHSPSP